MQSDRVRRERPRRERLLQAEGDEDAAGIGRKLHAGADRIESRRLLEDNALDAARGERQRRRQSANSRPRNDDAAGVHFAQAATSLTMLSGGIAAPGATEGSSR